MNHLGSRVAALVDGQLAPDVTERANAHVAACPRCWDLVRAERAARRAVSSAPDVEPSAELTARLLAMVAPGTSGPACAVAADGWGTVTAQSRGHGTSRGGWPVLAAVAGAAAMAGGLFVLGSGSRVGSGSVDVLDLAGGSAPMSAMLARAGVVGSSPSLEGSLSDLAPGVNSSRRAGARPGLTAAVLEWMAENGWPTPVGLPNDTQVVDVRWADGGVLEVEMTSPDSRVMLVEQRGRLDEADVRGYEAIEVGGRSVHLISAEPWTVLVDSGDAAVAVISEGSSDAGERVLAALPAGPDNPGPVDRIARGWGVLVSSVTGPTRD